MRQTLDVQCSSCGARLVLEANLRTIECPYCAASSIVERAADPERPAPSFVLGFAVSQIQARERAAEWLRTRSLFAKKGLHKAAVENVRGIYVPAYLYSSAASSTFSAEIGEEYQRTESYTTTENGKTVRKTRTVTEIEWRPLSGRLAEYIPDVLVTASRGLANDELEAIEPFDLRLLRRYDPALLSGWAAEEPSISSQQCLELARREALERTSKRLDGFMPGDKHRGLEQSTELSNEALDLCLVPVWVMAARYRENAEPVRIVINGQSGEIHGETPLSWLKIGAAIAVFLAVVAAVVFALSAG